jgi:hypothetical protein
MHPECLESTSLAPAPAILNDGQSLWDESNWVMKGPPIEETTFDKLDFQNLEKDLDDLFFSQLA